MYRAYGLLKPENDFDLTAAATRLESRFPDYAVRVVGGQITVSKGDWEIELALASGPQVQSESQGILDKVAGMEPEEVESIVRSEKRVEVWSDTPDPFMEHFNDYLVVVEVLKTFNGVVAVDPQGATVL